MARRLSLSSIVVAAVASACAGGGDVPTGRANPAEATVFVQDYWGRGVHGLWVASHDSAGNLVAEKQTGGSGAAHLALAGSNGSVTMYVEHGEMLVMETVLHAGAGPIRFIVSPLEDPPPDFPAPTQFHVTAAVPPETAWLTADIGCFAATGDGPPVAGVITVELTDEPCTQLETESIFLSARNGTGGEIAWGLLGAVTEDPGEMVSLSGAALETGYLDWTITAEFPEAPEQVEGAVSGFFTADFVGQREGAPIATVTSGAMHAITSRLPDAPFVSFARSVFATHGSTQLFAFSASTTAGGAAFSFAGLPAVSVAPLDDTESARPVIRWTEPSSLDANVGIAGSYWMRASGGSTYFSASFPADRSLPEVRMPEIPARFSAWSEGAITSTHVTFVEYRRSSIVRSDADIAADYYRGMGGMAPALPITFLSSQSVAP